jgi:hypothetical protein
MNYSNEKLRMMLREPATPTERLNAMGVHSIASVREEDRLIKQQERREAWGHISVPVGLGFSHAVG